MTGKDVIDLLKDWGLALAIALVAWALWRLLAPAPVDSGDAPELTLPDLQGETWVLAEQDVEAYVVNFWATWCAPCRQEIPEFAAFAQRHPEVVVVGVSVDEGMSRQVLAAKSRQLGITYPVVHDVDASTASNWGVTGFPTTFVLDAHRHVVDVKMGVLDGARLEAMVQEARAGH